MFKLNTVIHKTKIVKYFNNSLTIPNWVRYIATSENGEIYGYDSKPSLWKYGYVERNKGLYVLIGVATFEGDWKESLVKIDNFTTHSTIKIQ